MNANTEAIDRLEAYEAAASASRALLRAAREGNWTEFDRMQGQCHAIVAQLRSNAQRETLPPVQANRRREILAAILADDRCIRNILEPRSARFERLLDPGAGVGMSGACPP